MARYAADSKERVRDAIDMVDLVSAKTELRRAGAASFQGLCPFHEERTPSFGIDPVKKVFHCFGCQAGGDVFDFVMETEGMDFPAALESLADRYGVELEREDEDPQAAARRARRERLLALLERTAEYYVRVLWDAPEAADAREYLAGRGLREEVLRHFRVGFAPSAWDRVTVASRRAGFTESELHDGGVALRSKSRGSTYDRFRRRIMFPLTDNRGRVLGFGGRAIGADQKPKYLNSSENQIYHKGRALFGLDHARAPAAKAGSTILVEGYTDVLAMHQAGLENTVGLMGTALTAEQVTELGRLAPRVDLALDADASGQEAMLRAERLGAERRLEFRVVPMRDGSDPADLLATGSPEEMRALVDSAVPFARFQVARILDTGDLDSAGGRDRSLAELRGVVGALPPSPTREELVRLVAGRLGLSESLVASLTSAPVPQSDGAASRAAASAPRALDRREQTERTFLALCIALPEPGRDALRRVDLERHFTGAVVRRAAEHLRSHLTAPLEGVPPEDSELSGLLAELALRAARDPGGPATLEVQLLQLEMARLEREIASARAEGSLDISDLAQRRTEVKREFDSALDRATEG